MLDERDDAADNEPIKEVHNVQIDDVVVDRVGYQDAKTALVTLEQRPTNVTPLIWNVYTCQKEIGSQHAQASHHTTIDALPMPFISCVFSYIICISVFFFKFQNHISIIRRVSVTKCLCHPCHYVL